MKCFVNFVEGNHSSAKAVEKLKQSLDKYGWNYELVPGITPSTLDDKEFPWENLPNSRFANYSKKFHKKFRIKKSCFFNHLRFARKVIEANESMIFLEHDVVALEPFSDFDFEDYCFLNMQSAFGPPSILQKKFIAYHKKLKDFVPESKVYDFPNDYPLIYRKDNVFSGAKLTPGTGSYALSPSGARKLLESAEKNGLEQSDYSYNSKVMRLQAAYPSPFALQKTNPGLSNRL